MICTMRSSLSDKWSPDIKEFSMINRKSILIIGFATLAWSATAIGQNTFGTTANTQIQLPVVSFFNIRTVVSVPDGGIMSLGGVSRFASGTSTRGVPGLGRAFSNRSFGSQSSASNASVRVRILSNREMSEDVLATADRQAAIYESSDPNGSKAVQAKADFISRNVGRSKR
jgi:hypothetical protein